MPDWFRDQVDRTSRPDLPAFDPAAAVQAVDGGRSVRRSGGECANRSSGRGTRTSDSGSVEDHPLSDV
jgi:hypothetical protein